MEATESINIGGVLIAILFFSYVSQVVGAAWQTFISYDPKDNSDNFTIPQFFICLIPFGIFVVLYLKNVQTKKEEQVRKLNAIHIPQSSISTSAAELG